jgi:hypothetical protein
MSGRGTWIGFLAMAFAVVGLSGLFATYAMQAPWKRAAVEIAALDGDGSVESRIAAALGHDAASQMAVPGVAPEAALRAARASVLRRAEEDAAVSSTRTRWIIVIVTVTAAAFGAAVLGAAQGAAKGSAERRQAGTQA